MTKVLVNIDVGDIAAGEAFYCAAFSLAPARRLGKDALELVGANCTFFLLANAEGTQASATSAARRSYDRHWTPVHLDFVVESLEAALERSLAAGATQEGDVRDNSWGRIVTMADPFGHGYCLIEFSEAGYDAIASAERDSEGNTWQLRRLADGSTHRVLKNFPSGEELREAVSGIATGVHLREWEFFWVLEYRVPGR